MDLAHEKRKYDGSGMGGESPGVKVAGLENEMDVPRDKVAQIIGHRGSVIQEIMSRSGCRIVINQDVPESEPNKAVFTGNANQIENAKALIQAVIEYGPGGLHKLGIPGNENVVSESIECPHDKVGIVIGAKGVVISEIMKRTNCKIVVVQDVPEGSPAIVNITGPEDRIADVKACVNKVIEIGPQVLSLMLPVKGRGAGGAAAFAALDLSTQAILTESMDIPKERIAITIGAKGAVIQEMMRRSGCKIVIDQESIPCKANFTGVRNQIDSAKAMVSAVVASGPAVLQSSFLHGPAAATTSLSTSQDIPLLQNQVGAVIGPGGSTIRELQSRCGIRAKIDQPSGPNGKGPADHILHISGEPDRIRVAIQVTYDLIEYGPQVVFSRMDEQSGRAASSSAPQLAYHQGSGQQYQGQSHGYPYQTHTSNGGSGSVHHSSSSSGGNQYYQHQQQHQHQHQHQHQPAVQRGSRAGAVSSAAVSSQVLPGTLGLGVDGSAGQLLPPTNIAGGLQHQVVYIRSDQAGRVIGKHNSTLILIKSKSGADLQLAPRSMTTSSDQPQEINVIGSPHSVSLAGQMIQEALTGGLSKIQMMPDVPTTVPSTSSSPYRQNPQGQYPMPVAAGIATDSGKLRGHGPSGRYTSNSVPPNAGFYVPNAGSVGQDSSIYSQHQSSAVNYEIASGAGSYYDSMSGPAHTHGAQATYDYSEPSAAGRYY